MVYLYPALPPLYRSCGCIDKSMQLVVGGSMRKPSPLMSNLEMGYLRAGRLGSALGSDSWGRRASLLVQIQSRGS
jgi:hypothetical protein